MSNELFVEWFNAQYENMSKYELSLLRANKTDVKVWVGIYIEFLKIQSDTVKTLKSLLVRFDILASQDRQMNHIYGCFVQLERNLIDERV